MARFDSVLLDLVGQMLRPILRFCLRHRLALQQILDVTKAVLVELATEEIKKSGEKATQSRISVLSGVHRRDVARLTKHKGPLENRLGLSSKVLNRWENDQRFTTTSNKPKRLTFEGDKSEFSTLVSSVSKDVKPATVLFELERSGIVEKKGGQLSLIEPVNRLQHTADKGLHLLALDIEMLVRSVEENIFGQKKDRNLHLRTEYDNIYFEDIPKIRAWLRDQGAELHRKAREYLSKRDADINPSPSKTPGAHIVLGSFSWTSEEQPPEAKPDS